MERVAAVPSARSFSSRNGLQRLNPPLEEIVQISFRNLLHHVLEILPGDLPELEAVAVLHVRGYMR